MIGAAARSVPPFAFRTHVDFFLLPSRPSPPWRAPRRARCFRCVTATPQQMFALADKLTPRDKAGAAEILRLTQASTRASRERGSVWQRREEGTSAEQRPRSRDLLPNSPRPPGELELRASRTKGRKRTGPVRARPGRAIGLPRGRSNVRRYASRLRRRATAASPLS